MTSDEKNKLSHEATLKELHKADDLVETHSGLVIAISGAALGFTATHLEQSNIIYFVAAFGIFVAIEWILKIIRHQQIFMAALGNLREVENNKLGLEVKTARPEPYKYLPNGFNILLGFAILLIIMWVFLCIGIQYDWFNQKSISASQVVEKVSKELPTLSNVQNCSWILSSMEWDKKKRVYDIVAECSTQPVIWLLTYDISDDRVIKSQRK